MLNLNTKAKTIVDVEKAVGDYRIFDVKQASDTRVFVTSNSQGGDGYLAYIKLDEGNAVERLGLFTDIRTEPRLAVDYGNYVYVSNSTYLWGIDVSKPQPSQVSYKSLTYSPGSMAVNGNSKQLFTSGGKILTAPGFQLLGDLYTGGVPILDSSGSKVYYFTTSMIETYDQKNVTFVKRFQISHVDGSRCKLSQDNTMFYMLTHRRYALEDYRVYLVPNQ